MQGWTLADCLATKMVKEYFVIQKMKHGAEWYKFKKEICDGKVEVWHEVHNAVEKMPGGRGKAVNASTSTRAQAENHAKTIMNELIRKKARQ